MSPTDDPNKTEPAAALLRSAVTGDLQALKRSLAAGVSPDTGDDFGWTALHTAASQGKLAMIALLLEAGEQGPIQL